MEENDSVSTAWTDYSDRIRGAFKKDLKEVKVEWAKQIVKKREQDQPGHIKEGSLEKGTSAELGPVEFTGGTERSSRKTNKMVCRRCSVRSWLWSRAGRGELEKTKRELKEKYLMKEKEWTQKGEKPPDCAKYQFQLHCFNWSFAFLVFKQHISYELCNLSKNRLNIA